MDQETELTFVLRHDLHLRQQFRIDKRRRQNRWQGVPLVDGGMGPAEEIETFEQCQTSYV